MKRKNGFFTFCFAFIPGIGQMYLGYMKRGVSLLSAFCLTCFVAGFFNMGLLMVLAPIIWAYSFFDTFNLNNQQDAWIEDDYLFDVENFLGNNWKNLLAGRHGLFGGILIFLGVYALYTNFIRPYIWQISWLAYVMDALPSLVLSIALIGLGVYLLRGPKKEETDYVAFQADAPKEEDKNNE